MLHLRGTCLMGYCVLAYSSGLRGLCIRELLIGSTISIYRCISGCFGLCLQMLPAVYTTLIREKHKLTRFVSIYNHKIIYVKRDFWIPSSMDSSSGWLWTSNKLLLWALNWLSQENEDHILHLQLSVQNIAMWMPPLGNINFEKSPYLSERLSRLLLS